MWKEIVLVALGAALLCGQGSCGEEDTTLQEDLVVHYVKSGGFADIVQELLIERSGGGDGSVVYVSDIPSVDVEEVFVQEEVENLIRVFETADFCAEAGDYVPPTPTHNDYLYDITYELGEAGPCNARWMDSSSVSSELTWVRDQLEDIKASLTQ